jgi:hypothetical protein
MLGLIAAIVPALALAAAPVSASTAPERVPVDVRLTGDDGLTQNLRVSLERGLGGDSELRLATATDHAELSIESDSNVRWDRLNGNTVIIYTVYLARPQDRGEPETGICWERDIDKCVRDILRWARISAGRE